MIDRIRPAKETDSMAKRGRPGGHVHQPGTESHSPRPGITPDFAWKAIRRWWLTTTPIGLILAGSAVGLLMWVTVPLFQATAWVQIQDRRPHIAFAGAMESGRFVQTQVELIRSPLVLSGALARPDIARLAEVKESFDPVIWASQNVIVKPVGGSDLYQIAFKSRDPVTAAKMSNSVMDVYLELQNTRSSEQIELIVRLLEEEKSRRISELEQLREKVRVLYGRVYPHAPQPLPPGHKGQIDPGAAPLQREQDQLAAAEVERAVLEARVKAYDKLMSTEKLEVPEVVVEKLVEERPEVLNVRGEIASKQERLKALAQVAAKGADDPAAKRTQQEISALERALESTRNELRTVVGAEFRAEIERDRQEAAATMQTQLKAQVVLESVLQERITSKRQELEHTADRSLELEFARNDLARAEDVYERIAGRITSLRTEKDAPAQVSMLQRATPPTRPLEQYNLKKLGLTGTISFCIPFFLAVLWELRVRRISTAEQIQTEVCLDVLGEVTMIPMRSRMPGRRAADRYERDCSTFEESIESLRTSLTLSDDLRELQVIVVASAISREGKSSIASQLAASLANCCQEPVLLIDTDMRAPTMHQLFGIRLEPGLAELLSLTSTVEQSLITNWSSRVHLLPAGRLNDNPHALLSSPVFEKLLTDMRSRYSYIVIDAPPVLAASEALLVAKAADGTLLCTMRDYSKAPQLRLACNRLVMSGARLLGAVLSGVPSKDYAGKYGGYEYYARRYRNDHRETQIPLPSTDESSSLPTD